MAIIETMTEAIWPCLPATWDYLAGQRTDSLPAGVRAGINFSIILGSACHLEGILETSLKTLLRHRRSVYNRINVRDFEMPSDMSSFYNRLEEDLEERTTKAIGASGYEEMFELIAGTPLSALEHVEPIWEGVTVLFHFRNALGHGRQVLARKRYVEEPWREEFKGSYRRVEEYLLKRKIMDSKFIEGKSEFIFLADPIADHFRAIAASLPTAIVRSLPDEESRELQRVFKMLTQAG